MLDQQIEEGQMMFLEQKRKQFDLKFKDIE